MPPAVPGPALQTIDRDGAGVHLVLTSRPDEYRAAFQQGRLWGASVIDLLPIDLQHAKGFLLAEQLDPARQAWQQVIEYMRAHPDSVPTRTLTTPLALSLARDTSTRADPAALLDARAYPTPEALLQHLFAGFLDLAYPDQAQRQYAIRWLGWIARQMGANRDLRWWDIPAWFPTWQRRLVILLTGQLSTLGHRVAVIDVDLHHGNGTRAVFWQRPDVFYGSVHIDPGAGYFPHFLGHADETGAGDGVGSTRNEPLAPGTGDLDWIEAVARLAEAAVEFRADALVVSLGLDAAVDHPGSPLRVTGNGYAGAGRLLTSLELPTIIVQEGGTHLPVLATLVAGVLAGFAPWNV